MPTPTIKISQLDEDTTPATADMLPMVDETGPTTKRVSIANLIALLSTGTDGWTGLAFTPNSITANGNRSYSLVYNAVDLTSILSAGAPLKFTRTIAAPSQCTSLNGTNQYFSKTSPAAMTFTDDFTVSAYVKLTAYGASSVITSRHNGTSGWIFYVDSTGRVTLAGYNGSLSNISFVFSNRSIPLNKWVHVAAQLDMSTFTATPTTSYTMIDGLDVPATVTRGGTNPTALVQAGDLEVGAYNGATAPFPGEISQVAIYNAKVTQANILATISQGLIGTETSLISAYSLSNSVADLNTTNANNLSAQNSALTTAADSPFAQGASAGSLEYGIIMSIVFSTNTTVVVQVPEGSAIPTTGGVGATSYSVSKHPLNFPAPKRKWRLEMVDRTTPAQSATVGVWYNLNSMNLSIPIGEWIYGYEANPFITVSANSASVFSTLSTANNTESDKELTAQIYQQTSGSTSSAVAAHIKREKSLSLSAATIYYLNAKTDLNNANTLEILGAVSTSKIYIDNAYI